MGKLLMPYSVKTSEDGKKFTVINSDTGKEFGEHDSKKDAVKQMRALYASVKDSKSMSEIFDDSLKGGPGSGPQGGGGKKDIKDGEEHRVGPRTYVSREGNDYRVHSGGFITHRADSFDAAIKIANKIESGGKKSADFSTLSQNIKSRVAELKGGPGSGPHSRGDAGSKSPSKEAAEMAKNSSNVALAKVAINKIGDEDSQRAARAELASRGVSIEQADKLANGRIKSATLDDVI